MIHVRRRLDSAHLLAIIAIVLALAAPAGAALVTARGIANNAIESRHIRNGKIVAADLAARSVTNRQLAIGAVKATNLANGAVGATQVADGSLTGTDLVDGSVSAVDLAPGTVGASALAAGSIGATLIADGGVGTADIADGAVTSGKLVSGAVTGSKLGDLSVTSGKLADGAVTSAKFATGAVDETAIGAGAVDSIELADGSVLAQHMTTGSVTGAALGSVVGAGVSATGVTVPTDVLDSFPTPEETDGVIVPFATELFDTAGIWTIGTPGSLVVPSTGLYEVHAWVDWDADNDGYREVQVVANGAIVAQERRATFAGSIGNRSNMTITALFAATAGQVVNLRISHTAGNDLSASNVRLTMHRVGTTA